MTVARQLEAETFIIRLARALHSYGSPAHRLEDAMSMVSESLGVDASFFASPTAVMVSFGMDSERRTVLDRVRPGEHNLEKLVELDRVATRVGRDPDSIKVATADIDRIVCAPLRYGPWITMIAFGVASGGAGRFFGQGVIDVLTAAIIGLLIGLLAAMAERSSSLPRVFEAAAALLASTVAAVAASYWGASAFAVTISGLIVLVPGLTLTVAMAELATQHLVSGTARLTGAATIFLMIGFGVALGSRTAVLLPEPKVIETIALPAWTEFAAVIAVTLALVVLFRAHPRDTPTVVLAGAIGFYGAQLGGVVLGSELGAFIGGMLVGLTGNLYARRFDRPAAVATMPGILLLVPGSTGLRSLFSMMEHNVLSGIEAAHTTAVVASALVAGLLVSNIVIPPRKAL